MAQVEISELRRNLSTILAELSASGPIEVTRHGQVIATLGGPPKQISTLKPKINKRRLGRICQRHHIKRLALFGSILRDDFGPESDVDVLIDLEPGRMRSIGERVAAEVDLAKLFGRQVDLVKRPLIEGSSNEVRKHAILGTAKVIYEAPR